jgi:penicillin-binding protein 2
MGKLRDRYSGGVEVEEVLLDASNILSLNQGRLEGKREQPIKKSGVRTVGIIFSCIAVVFFYHIFKLQVIKGAEYRTISENNTLSKAVIVAERGVIFDRTGDMLVWNEADKTGQYDFPVRAYTNKLGLGQILGYVSYPKRDNKGFYFRTDYLGRSGVELTYDDVLKGENGNKVVEVNALNKVISEYEVEHPKNGQELHLSIDSDLTEAMYNIIASSTKESGARSGAAAIMDVHTGEIIAMTSFPSYDPEVMANGDDTTLIKQYNEDTRFPFLNKVLGGVYTPGSIVKPFVAYAGLKEGVISSNTHIYSNGKLTIPNPYTPSQPSYFADWRAQGDMTVREGLAYSSNVFFYIVGGGLPQIAVPQAGIDHAMQGVGITKLDSYFDYFNFGHKTNIKMSNEQEGTVPSQEWKKKQFNEDWRLGDTYFTSIGQYGWQVTPLQMLVAYGALANGGRFFTPHLVSTEKPEYVDKPLDPNILQIVHEGMRMTTTLPRGTALSLKKPYVDIAAKSGTAELDFAKARLNTWAAGFWPYEHPRYAFIMMMENAPYTNRLGGTKVMGTVMDWIHINRPEYLKASSTAETTQ